MTFNAANLDARLKFGGRLTLACVWAWGVRFTVAYIALFIDL